MSGADILDFTKDALWVMLLLAGPLLLTALSVGLVISLFQALTQIQEMSLTFVPKIISVFLVLFFMLPGMGKILESFAHRLFDRIVTIEEKR
jgi:flagellar biosynthetic protein FliQ